VHYIKWKQEKTLKLDAYPTKPDSPIDPMCDQERKFITSIVQKHPEWTNEQLLEHLEGKKNAKRSQPL
jgi:hypothetical protein